MYCMQDSIIKGILTQTGSASFIQGADGVRRLENDIIWSGYLRHWTDRAVCARKLPQKDYETGKPIIIMWPDEPFPEEPTVELYFNERLVKYPVSFLGHLAVNVHGEIFNFSHLINENEVMRREEYFYRPALGEFAPHPQTGRHNTDDPQKPYFDKFGRLFMRTIHVLRITGLDTAGLSQIFHHELENIRNAPPHPRKPEHYTDFNLFTNNCSTIIRRGFNTMGFTKIRGIFPRDLFVNASYYFMKQATQPHIRASRHALSQLRVPEAAPSAMPPLINPLNRYKDRLLKRS